MIEKIKKKKIIIGIFGLGYIGLPRCIQFSRKKFKVLGFDDDLSKIKKLNASKSYLTTVRNKDISQIKNYFTPTSNFSRVKELDVIILCLPTPLKSGKPDLSYIRNTLKIIKPYLKQHQFLSLESTSYPGTTEEEICKPLSKKFKIGKNFFISFSPERDDPGRKFDNFYIPRIVSGYSKKCRQIASKLYSFIFNEIVEVENTRTAEMTKIYENVYRSVNIGLVNELKKISHKMNIDINSVIEAAKTKPYGFNAFYPGPGLGGHCIPIDPIYLSWKAKKYGLKTNFIELAAKINSSMPQWVISQLENHLKRKKKNYSKTKILILGVTYKKNINDTRESPGLKIIDLLTKKGYDVSYSDPYISKLKKYRNYKFYNQKSKLITKKLLHNTNVVILLVDHDKFDKNYILKYSRTIIDTRNFFKTKSKKIINA